MTYAQLPESTASGEYAGCSLSCRNPECDYFMHHRSATRGDYFWADPRSEVRCACGEPMQLGKTVTRFIEVAPQLGIPAKW